MPIHITCLGAAQTVTGSMHLVTTSRSRVLLDCGLFQGRRRESFERNRHLPFDPARLDAVVLSHAHIDHSGALPMLARTRFDGSVYATPATRDLAAIMLEDAALIQAADARHVNRSIERGELDSDPVEPSYTTDDVVAILGRTISIPYHHAVTIAPGMTLTFLDAGHVLGSAVVVLDVEDEGKRTRIAFSGDLGRTGTPILHDPEVPSGVSTLLLESTYGDRVHPSRREMDDALAAIVTRVVERGGKIVVPTFALERAQEIVLTLKKLATTGRLPDVPIYVDSPLTVKVTEVFRMHVDSMDADARESVVSGESPFDFAGLHYVSDVEDSRALCASEEPAIVLAASGMCESGRVVHHLRSMLGDPRSAVVIVGFQAPYTLGRRLVERCDRVRLFGVEHERRCEVETLDGFSAHAGQDELLRFAGAVRERGSLQHVALVHGELPAQRALQTLLHAHGIARVSIPERGERFAVVP